nr:glycine-rich protein 1-like isoform X1 [Setaria viridis]
MLCVRAEDALAAAAAAAAASDKMRSVTLGGSIQRAVRRMAGGGGGRKSGGSARAASGDATASCSGGCISLISGRFSVAHRGSHDEALPSICRSLLLIGNDAMCACGGMALELLF